MEIEIHERLLKIDKVEELVGFKKAKIYGLMKQGKFPKNIKIGGNTLWKYSEISKYITSF